MALYFAIPNFWCIAWSLPHRVPTRSRQDRTLAFRNADRIDSHVQRAARRLELAAAKERRRRRDGRLWTPGGID